MRRGNNQQQRLFCLVENLGVCVNLSVDVCKLGN